MQSAETCLSASQSTCNFGSDACDDEVTDDDGMAGLPDIEETLNVFLR